MADGIHMDQPPVSHRGQRTVEHVRNIFALFVRAVCRILTDVDPRGHKRTVFAGNDAVFDDGGIVEKIGNSHFF